jgi:hypothetical protein
VEDVTKYWWVDFESGRNKRGKAKVSVVGVWKDGNSINGKRGSRKKMT